MMSSTASRAWNHLVLLLCCTEPAPSRGVVLPGRVTTVAMSRSDQLGMRCTVEPNCSGLSARLADTSVTRNRALDTCEPSCVPGAARPFFIPVVQSPLGAVGYVAAPELSSRGGEAGATWQRRSPPRQGGEVWSCGTHGSAGALLSGRQSPEPWDTWQRQSPPQ
jgi:hypothetical protein